jgi:hypothetical protein
MRAMKTVKSNVPRDLCQREKIVLGGGEMLIDREAGIADGSSCERNNSTGAAKPIQNTSFSLGVSFRSFMVADFCI